MSNDLIERNLAHLVRAAVARPDESAALRRFLRATQPGAPRLRWMPAAAALFLGALCFWVVLARDPDPVPAAQDSPRAKEIDQWISRLSAAEAAERNKAEQDLAGLGADVAHAIAALDRLRTSDDLELRARAARVRTALAERLLPGAIRESIATVRATWLKRDYTNLEDSIRKAFKPLELTYVRYASKVEIGDHLESDNGEDYMKFRPSSRFGGRRNLLTQPIFDALGAGDGIIGLDGETPIAPKKADDLASLGKCLIFTLPDERAGWPGYVVISYRTKK